uniref:Uncharacterized protein n=1 Tax=Zea mays TaxID=4577 RepID=A0A804NNE3_MAIZE
RRRQGLEQGGRLVVVVRRERLHLPLLPVAAGVLLLRLHARLLAPGPRRRRSHLRLNHEVAEAQVPGLLPLATGPRPRLRPPPPPPPLATGHGELATLLLSRDPGLSWTTVWSSEGKPA